MCGRYFLLDEILKNNKQLSEQLKKQELTDYKVGEVFPGDNCLVLIEKKNGVELAIRPWGIKKDHFMINARIENPVWKDVAYKRCAVIISGFYEWKGKEKFSICTHSPFVCLAALYDENDAMVIITKEATKQMKNIHERMPLIMDQKEMLTYLRLDKRDVSDKELVIEKADNEQITLF